MPRTVVLFSVLFSAVALAGPRESAVSEALDELKDAQDEAADASGACRRSLKGLDSLADKLKALQRDATDKGLARAREQAEELADAAKDDCKGSVARRVRRSLDKVVSQLERAQDAKTTASAPEKRQETQSGGNVLVNLAGGIGSLFAGAQSSTTVNKTETRTTKRTEEVNGRSVDDEDEDDAPARKSSRSKAPARGGFQATCRTNADCESNTCYVGSGELGYCTKMCDSWSDCPSFWECKRAANAPQTLCMQK
ncbi:MAG: hypothetical protein ACOZQL_17505 [Myxococcota bacterium]